MSQEKRVAIVRCVACFFSSTKLNISLGGGGGGGGGGGEEDKFNQRNQRGQRTKAMVATTVFGSLSGRKSADPLPLRRVSMT